MQRTEITATHCNTLICVHDAPAIRNMISMYIIITMYPCTEREHEKDRGRKREEMKMGTASERERVRKRERGRDGERDKERDTQRHT